MSTTLTQLAGTQDTVHDPVTTAALANNANALSPAYTPTSLNYPRAEVEFTGQWGTAPSANTGLSVWFLRRPNGTDYEDGDATPTTPARAPDVVIPVRAVNTAQRVVRECWIPPGTLKVLVRNDGTGQQLSAGWGLKVRPLTEQGS